MLSMVCGIIGILLGFVWSVAAMTGCKEWVEHRSLEFILGLICFFAMGTAVVWIAKSGDEGMPITWVEKWFHPVVLENK